MWVHDKTLRIKGDAWEVRHRYIRRGAWHVGVWHGGRLVEWYPCTGDLQKAIRQVCGVAACMAAGIKCKV